jgi:ppGpp synthetase/RelA/SpoT-type nucleotidyltranferase
VNAPVPHFASSVLAEENEYAWLDQMAWATNNYTPQVVNAAGRTLVRLLRLEDVQNWKNEDWLDWARIAPIINNWRACHGYPLNTFQINLRRTARRFDEAPLIAQRTKRLNSIAHKLDREPQMKLSQMQDIGGCRAVVKSIIAARRLHHFYRDESEMKHKFAKCDDYIKEPRATGYRSIHLVYRFFSDKKAGAPWNGLKIEMQIRSQYQHAWATAVETVGTFLGEALKSASGPDEWLRFFALMGSVIAMRERAPLVPGTPTQRQALITELDHHAYILNVENRLVAFGNAMRSITTATDRAHWYLLKLDASASQLVVTGFKRDEFEEAQTSYSEAEELVKGKPGRDAVLVSVDSLAALERAYPNYFADTRVFVELMKQALSGHQRRIFTGDLALPSSGAQSS